MDYIGNRDGIVALLKENVRGEKFEHSLGGVETAIAQQRMALISIKRVWPGCCTILPGKRIMWRLLKNMGFHT